jgi:hypothetical protein
MYLKPDNFSELQTAQNLSNYDCWFSGFCNFLWLATIISLKTQILVVIVRTHVKCAYETI